MERQACSTAVPGRRRSFLSFRRNQVVSMDQSHDHELHEHDLFQSNVSQRLLSLLHEHNDDDHLLTIPFLSKLIQAFLCCEEEFRSLLHNSLACNPPLLSRPPLDRLLPDHLDRAVKSLDVFNAVTQTLESLRQLHRQADIAVSALLHRPPSQLGQAQLNRAKRALTKLFTHTHPSSFFRRGCSFSNRITGDVTPGLALSLHTMNSILTFLIWTLMSAFTGTSAGSAPPLVGLQERIWEELKKKKNGGVLLELQVLEKCSRAVLNAVEGCGDCCKDEMQMRDVAEKGVELGEACQRLNVGLGMFERLLREVFHRTVKSRGELQQCLDQSCRSSSSSSASASASASASFPL